MAEIKDLNRLIREMKPELADRNYVFCTLSESDFKKMRLNPLLVYKEKEGITVIIERKTAEANSLSYSGAWALITLTVHSDLSVVGFLARITNELEKAGISVNVVSAYYHDHLFVPVKKANEALKILKKLSES